MSDRVNVRRSFFPDTKERYPSIRTVDLLGLEAANGNLDDVTIRRPAKIEAAVPGRSVER